MASPTPVEALREALFDGYQRLLPRERVSAPAIIVEIDEVALARYGQWPWPRSQLAELVERIHAARPAAIGLDLLFPEPDRFSPGALARLPSLPAKLSAQLAALPSNDARLAEAIRGRKVVLAVAGLEQPDPRQPGAPQAAPVRWASGVRADLHGFKGRLGSIAEIERAAAGRGFISVDERVVRRVPLLADVAGNTVPALALEMWRVAMDASAYAVRPRPGRLLEVALNDVRIPAQADGSIWLRYSRSDPARFVSAATILEGKFDPDLLESKLVMVGITGLGLLDYKATPLGESVPGVEIHAQLAEQIFDGVFLVRPAWAAWLEAGLLALGVLLLIWIVPARRVALSSAALAALLAALLAAGIGAFRSGVLLDAAWPALGTALAFAALLAATLADAERQRRVLRDAAERAAGELEAAQRIQMGLLPDLPQLAHSLPALGIDGLLEPAHTVGGDFYDCLQLDRDRLFFVVGDVSGKGMPAALFMALCKAIIKAAAVRAGSDVGGILRRASGEISRENPEQLFVTAFAAILDLRTGMLESCNAGHEPPYHITAAGAVQRFPNAEGPPLCTMQDFAYVTDHRQLAEGDSLCVISDGVTEAMNARNELYGAHRLELALKFLKAGAAPSEIVAAVREDVQAFVGDALASDDLSLLALRWSSAGRAQAREETATETATETAAQTSADVDLHAPVEGLLDAVGGRH